MHKLKKYLSYYLHQMDTYLLLANYIYIYFFVIQPCLLSQPLMYQLFLIISIPTFGLTP